MIKLSVCIPMFRAKYIGWLALESLCRQKDINFEWELVVAEETNDEPFGEDEIMKYKDRLAEIGCGRINYIGLKKWVPLSNKYPMTAKACSESSRIYLSQGADIYSQPYRLKTQYAVFTNNPEIDFAVGQKTIFYDIATGRTFLYDVKAKKKVSKSDGADRSFRLEIIKNLPEGNKKEAIDGWSWRQANEYVKTKGKEFKYYMDTSDNWQYGMNVHGLNNISHKRSSLFNKFRPEIGVVRCPVNINTTIPAAILHRLKAVRKFLTKHKKGLP